MRSSLPCINLGLRIELTNISTDTSPWNRLDSSHSVAEVLLWFTRVWLNELFRALFGVQPVFVNSTLPNATRRTAQSSKVYARFSESAVRKLTSRNIRHGVNHHQLISFRIAKFRFRGTSINGYLDISSILRSVKDFFCRTRKHCTLV